MKTSYRSNLSRARGIGPSKQAVKSWLLLRVSSVALIPLCVWFVYSMVQLAHTGVTHDVVLVWLKMPINAFLSIMLVGIAAVHGYLGNKEIIEDYVHSEGLKHIGLVFKKLGYLFAAAAAVFAILSIYFKG